MLRAIDLGGADAVLARLADGLDTRLGTDGAGADLSGGQWQRLALARSSMRETPLLVVLDEPTAALEPIAEYEIFERVTRLARHRTERYGAITIAITHRYSMARTADLIVVVHDGGLQEIGAHDDLMAYCGRYAAMYARERDAFLEPHLEPAPSRTSTESSGTSRRNCASDL
ncbi:ATP-binding cassette domain-containing protein [Streptomyces bobili]|uniref:ATP-binding cassette domain-containing protein n=1 Tax=Streptomyces bobili TaxID=67280 RepID=UPI003445DBAC